MRHNCFISFSLLYLEFKFILCIVHADITLIDHIQYILKFNIFIVHFDFVFEYIAQIADPLKIPIGRIVFRFPFPLFSASIATALQIKIETRKVRYSWRSCSEGWWLLWFIDVYNSSAYCQAPFLLILLTGQTATAGNWISHTGCRLVNNDVYVGFDTNPSNAYTNMYPHAANAHICIQYHINLFRMDSWWVKRRKVNKMSLLWKRKQFQFHTVERYTYFSNVDRFLWTRYLKPCSEVLSRNCRIVMTNNWVQFVFRLLRTIVGRVIFYWIRFIGCNWRL